MLHNPFRPDEVKPTPKQCAFLMDMSPEAFYGGAAGGGKSYALLLAAIQFIDWPSYNALLLRRTYADLAKPGALMDLGHMWFGQTEAKWVKEEHKWIFPSGATLSFGYLDTDQDRLKYRGAQYSFVGFDETTLFTEAQYTYLFSRLRKLQTDPFPTRMRAASNPGGIGHAWVKDRFLVRGIGKFYPAKLTDNPFLNQQDYIRQLDNLTPVERAQLLQGCWDEYEGGRFQREWFKTYAVEDEWLVFDDDHRIRRQDLMVFMTVDPAATPEATTQKMGDQDYTVIGTYGCLPWGGCVVLNITRERIPLDRIVPRIASECAVWSPVFVGIEALAFQAYLVVDAKRRSDIPNVKALSPTAYGRVPNVKAKLARATPAIIWANEGKIWLPSEAPWKKIFLDELCMFTGDPKLDAHDDQVDSLAYAIQELKRGGFLPGRDLVPTPQRSITPTHHDSAPFRRGLYGLRDDLQTSEGLPCVGA